MIGKPRAASGGAQDLVRPDSGRPELTRAERTRQDLACWELFGDSVPSRDMPDLPHSRERAPAPGEPPPPQRGVLRTVLATVALSAVVIVTAAAWGAKLFPVGDWIDDLTPRAELAGTVTAVTVESAPHSTVRRWRAPSMRVVVKIAPYSFGFAYPCGDAAYCRGLADQVQRGGMASVAVDKAEFENLAPANRTVSHASRDPARIGQQFVAAALDPRRVRLFQLEQNGVAILPAH